MFIRKKQTFASIFFSVFIISTILIYFSAYPAKCAPTNNNNSNGNNNGNNRNTRNGGILSSLFGRQTRSSQTKSGSNSDSNNESTSTEADLEDPQTQTELEAEKFVDSLPIPVSFSP